MIVFHDYWRRIAYHDIQNEFISIYGIDVQKYFMYRQRSAYHEIQNEFISRYGIDVQKFCTSISRYGGLLRLPSMQCVPVAYRE